MTGSPGSTARGDATPGLGLVAAVSSRAARDWPSLRYARLLPWAARGRAQGRAYAQLVAAVELGRDAARRRTAVARIRRWTGCSAARAVEVFRRSLFSEALEEADSALFRRDLDAMDHWAADVKNLALPPGPLVFATLHLGSPVLGYLALRRASRLDVRAIGRQLDASNPMADAKRRVGLEKQEWVHRVAGVPLVDPGAASMQRAREHLLDGGALYAALDVPGDVVSRASSVVLCGERIQVSVGLTTLARLTRATILPLVAVSGRRRMALHLGDPVRPTNPAETIAAVFGQLERFIVQFPEEWWFWPYVLPANSESDEPATSAIGGHRIT